VYRHDYVMRLIERFGRALIALRDRILGRTVDAAELRSQLADIADQAGVSLEVARSLDSRTLLMWLAPTGEVDEPRFWLLAELLYLEGLHARQTGAPDAGRGDLARARTIFDRLPAGWAPSADFPSAGDRSAEIAGLLQQ
jgi:hypothetical protein